MKNRSYLLLCWFVLLIIFSGCSFSKVSYRDLSDISDKRLGILKGVLTEEPLAADYPQASVKAYGKPMELFMDIESGRCDVAVLNEETAIHVISRNSDYALLDTWKTSDEVWYVIVPKNLMDKEVRKKETDGGGGRTWEIAFIGICWRTMHGNSLQEGYIPRWSSSSSERYWPYCWLLY